VTIDVHADGNSIISSIKHLTIYTSPTYADNILPHRLATYNDKQVLQLEWSNHLSSEMIELYVKVSDSVFKGKNNGNIVTTASPITVKESGLHVISLSFNQINWHDVGKMYVFDTSSSVHSEPSALLLHSSDSSNSIYSLTIHGEGDFRSTSTFTCSLGSKSTSGSGSTITATYISPSQVKCSFNSEYIGKSTMSNETIILDIDGVEQVHDYITIYSSKEVTSLSSNAIFATGEPLVLQVF
jgi:hypothetical protein